MKSPAAVVPASLHRNPGPPEHLQVKCSFPMRDASSHPKNLLYKPPICPRFKSPQAQLTSERNHKHAPACVLMLRWISLAGDISQKALLISLHPPPSPHPPSSCCTLASGPASTEAIGNVGEGDAVGHLSFLKRLFLNTF